MGGAFPGGDLIEKKSFAVGPDGPFAASEGLSHDPEITLLKLAREVLRQLEDLLLLQFLSQLSATPQDPPDGASKRHPEESVGALASTRKRLRPGSRDSAHHLPTD